MKRFGYMKIIINFDPNIIQAIKAIKNHCMKKSVLLVISFLLGSFFSYSNPIEPPKVISELYIVNDSTWYLELVFSPPYNFVNFDNLSISSSSDTCSFKPGIRIISDSVIVITNDSLQTPLHLRRNGDILTVSGTFIYDQLTFGDMPNSEIAAPLVGQSIVHYKYSCWDFSSNGASSITLLVKDNNPSIGTNPFLPTTYMGTISGYVYDRLHRPVSGIVIGDSHYYYGAPIYYCQNYRHNINTDSTGFFSVSEYSGRRRIDFFLNSSTVYDDTTINIEPNTMNYFEFTIDSLIASIDINTLTNSITTFCYPNPTNCGTTIVFETPTNHNVRKILVKIYNSVGEIVKIIPVETVANAAKYSVIWDGLLDNNKISAGTYYYAIEMNGRKVVTNKIIVNE